MAPPRGVDDGSAPSLAVVALADGAEGEMLSTVNPGDGDESAASDVDGGTMVVKCDEGLPQPSWLDVPLLRRSPQVIVLCVGSEFAVLVGVVPSGFEAVFFLVRAMGSGCVGERRKRSAGGGGRKTQR